VNEHSPINAKWGCAACARRVSILNKIWFNNSPNKFNRRGFATTVLIATSEHYPGAM
jgi:hypothetical protein